MEAIILAGGLGTRLKKVIQDLPKTMAPIGGKPFLTYLFNYLINQGVSRLILSTGYGHKSIESYFGRTYRNVPIVYSVEEDPLGTGGAVMKAFQHVESDKAVVMNGDTFFEADLSRLTELHVTADSEFSIVLKPLQNFDRYGTVMVDVKNRIKSFVEKKYSNYGNINGGIYLINKHVFERFGLPERFSLETDFMQRYVGEIQMYGFVFKGYFIDIGIPEDYYRAQSELKIE